MAIGHFEKRQLLPDQIDWNFNLVFDGNTDVHRMAQEFAPHLTHLGLYPPIPPEWLHTAILRISTTEEYREEEMLLEADKVQLGVRGLELPEFRFDSWWLLFENVVFHISPGDEFTKLYDIVTESLVAEVGEE